MALQWGRAGDFANQFGVKSIVYGPPGGGKTPLIGTAPRPVLLAIEPGLLSMKNSTIPTAFAQKPGDVEEFVRWLQQSAEAKQFDTVGIDSGSQHAENILDEELSKKSSSGKKVDGKAAYGEMSKRAMDLFDTLYYLREKHVVLICKESHGDGQKRPYFPGKDLDTKVPHRYDEILRLAKTFVQGVGDVPALRAKEAYDAFARDRTGKLAEFEQPNLTALFNKLMQG